MSKAKGTNGMGETPSKFISDNGLTCRIQTTLKVQQHKGKYHFKIVKGLKYTLSFQRKLTCGQQHTKKILNITDY